MHEAIACLRSRRPIPRTILVAASLLVVAGLLSAATAFQLATGLLWPTNTPAHHPSSSPLRGRGAEGEERTELSAAQVKILSMQIHHFRNDHRLGNIGVESYAACFDDDVRVKVKLNHSAYCYLVAFNPNGDEQLCQPKLPILIIRQPRQTTRLIE